MDLTKTCFAGVFGLVQKQAWDMFYETAEGYYSRTMVQTRVTVKRVLGLDETLGYLSQVFSYSRRLTGFLCEHLLRPSF